MFEQLRAKRSCQGNVNELMQLRKAGGHEKPNQKQAAALSLKLKLWSDESMERWRRFDGHESSLEELWGAPDNTERPTLRDRIESIW